MKVSSLHRPVKDATGFKIPGVYSIPCESGKVYNEETGCPIENRIEDHHRYIWLYHPDKSSTAEHSIKLGHRFQFHDVSILAKKPGRMKRITREATNFELYPDNMKKEEGFSLSKTWKPLTRTLNGRKKTISRQKWLLVLVRAHYCTLSSPLLYSLLLSYSPSVLVFFLPSTPFLIGPFSGPFPPTLAIGSFLHYNPPCIFPL